MRNKLCTCPLYLPTFSAVFFAMIILLNGCSNEPPVTVSLLKVQSADEAFTIKHAGTVSLSNEVEIRSAVSGNITEKFFTDGADVTEGQLLFKIGEPESHTALLQSKAELAKSQTDLAKALVEKDSSAAELKRTAEENLELVKKLEEEATAGMIYAPKSGRLGAVDAPLGMQVVADETLLATVGNINPLAVRFEISQTEAQLLSKADNLAVKLKFSDGTLYPLDGTISISADNSTAEAVFDNSEGLLTVGTDVQIEIEGVKIVGVLLVPESAIQRREDGDFVFVADPDKRAAVRKISVGDKLGTNFIVKDGLKFGDLVVVEGIDNLREGTPLKSN